MSDKLLLDPNKVKPFVGQPRKRFAGITQLMVSIQVVGQVTPIKVTPLHDDPLFTHELIDGERRLKACQRGGMPVWAIVAEGKVDRFVESVAANFCRQDHDCIEISDAIIGMKESGKSIHEIATIFGKSRSWVMQMSSLSHLHSSIREKLIAPKKTREKGSLSYSLALQLTALKEEHQLEAVKHIQDFKLSIAAAKNYVVGMSLNAKTKDMIRPGSRIARKRGPTERFASLSGALDNFCSMLIRHAKSSPEELSSLFEAVGKEKVKSLSAQLSTLQDYITVIQKSANAQASV